MNGEEIAETLNAEIEFAIAIQLALMAEAGKARFDTGPIVRLCEEHISGLREIAKLVSDEAKQAA
jgi:hypothetical protein